MSGPDFAHVRAEEQRTLIRDVADAVTRQLARVSLQVMSHLDSTDPTDLAEALEEVGRMADSALAELRVLSRMVYAEPESAPSAELPGLLSAMTPTASGAEWIHRLSLAGHEPAIDVAAEADQLDPTLQRTICRILDVSGDNMLRHATPRSRCSVTVAVHPTHIVVRTASPTVSDHFAFSFGRGLLGLGERIDLTGGTFAAGPQSSGLHHEWVVLAHLPRNGASPGHSPPESSPSGTLGR